MIVETTTTDKQGREYKKVFSNYETESVFCFKGVNNVFKGKSNFSLRIGNSKYNDQVILQFIIDDKVKDYVARAEIDHIETYYPMNKDTLELFERITNIIRCEVDKNGESS